MGIAVRMRPLQCASGLMRKRVGTGKGKLRGPNAGIGVSHEATDIA
jgi:hypothetical protein